MTSAPSISGDPVIVSGDVWIDRLLIPEGPQGQQIAKARLATRAGGALLLAELVRQQLGDAVCTHVAAEGAKPVGERVLELDRYPAIRGARDFVYRARREFELIESTGATHAALPVSQDTPRASIVLLADAARGFRDARAAWPAAITDAAARPLVVLSSEGDLTRGALWSHLAAHHPDRLVLIVDADDVRAHANVSRGLSWERTAMDLLWQLDSNPALLPLQKAAHLVVRFDLDAAIHVTRAGGAGARLYYDPAAAEGTFRDEHDGAVARADYAFAAGIAAALTRGGAAEIGDGIPRALAAARSMLRLGFGARPDGASVVPRVFETDPRPGAFAAIDVPWPDGARTPDPGSWRILSTLSARRLEQIAYDIVRRGDADGLASVPIAQFGALRTIDRNEIESFRSIRRLMASYCALENPGRPLSIAVFGQPGSGKSFGVSQVAQAVARGRIEKRDFNLSQFESPADLTPAFHWVRDVALSGKIALAVFDEFDSGLQGARLGWLKSFLAPMQDGAFKEGEAMHPLGRAIFVFAGGTCDTYEAFCASGDAFREAKGPDFVSRLRGYVNVLGPNAVDTQDRFHVVRRAMLLRSLLSRKLPGVIGADGGARIDDGVLRAMMKVPAYRHGARSMEALLDMSALQDRETFDQSALPAADLMDLHTDAELFSKLVARDVVFGAGRERIARAIHEHYRETQSASKPAGDKAIRPWDELDETLKESNRHQADQIPEKLRIAGYGFAPAMNAQASVEGFTAEEIETLSEMEHERFVAERRAAGWTEGPRDVDAKRSPYLVPWSELEEAVREYDRNAVRAIPQLMAAAGFEIYRLD